MNTTVIAIFDVGKTNKKIILFDEAYQLLHEESIQLPETLDEDGFPCEDRDALAQWLQQSLQRLLSDRQYEIKAINFAAYGASLVHLDNNYQPLTAICNYLKPYPPHLQDQFYQRYGAAMLIAKQTASPVLGNLNSGMQLYAMKYEKKKLFKQIKYSLHLPQYLSFLIANKPASDITSLGCHTQLWDFERNDYHEWVKQEGILPLLAGIRPSDEPIGMFRDPARNCSIPVGIGLHDSSAALIPYIKCFDEPFILLSTGTWCISLNPFNHSPLTHEELEQDCLCYLSYEGKAIKASRLFAGGQHEEQARRLASHFNKAPDYFTTLHFGSEGLSKLYNAGEEREEQALSGHSFYTENLSSFATYEEAYQKLMLDLVRRQVIATKLVLKGSPVTRLFVDGGFSKNGAYMHLLAMAFPALKVSAASISQATALGAALSMHDHWNKQMLSPDLLSHVFETSNYRQDPF